jgi:hydrophobic/amphiphilic exporter-1 (mainly G- bacteria), HAE1 family
VSELIKRAILNTPAMNTLMVAILLLGGFSVWSMRREVFPEFELEIILVSVPYPGASPEEVEEGICAKIEEAVRSVDGIKKQTSVAKEGVGSVVLELHASADPQRALNEVRSEVDRIPSFPLLAEDPQVKQITLRQPAITVGVIGPESEHAEAERQLRDVAELVRDDLLRLPTVSQATIKGAKDYQIDVELSEETLRRYGLTLHQVAQIIRRANLELPAGTIRTDAQDILIRGKSKATVGAEIANIPVITQPGGMVLTLKDIGYVRDDFADVDSHTLIDGRPGMAVAVERTSSEDLILMTDAVRDYVRTKQMPPGYELITWADRSVEVRDRLALLTENGLQGLALVLISLTLFLNLRLAWWVAVGIPIAVLGACAVLYFGGQTMNMLTTFTFVMALGIVVDDAIVIGENVYAHRRMGKTALQAAIDGTLEVAPSVTASIATTIIAFMPLLFVSGVMGKFIAVMPVAMIAILVFSLFEATLVLPCHLAHESDDTRGPLAKSRDMRHRMGLLGRWTIGPLVVLIGAVMEIFFYPLDRLRRLVDVLNGYTNRAVDYVNDHLYSPLLARCIANPEVAASVGIAVLLVSVGLYHGGIVEFNIFPKLDANTIEANIEFPDGTPAAVTDDATRRLEASIREINERYAARGEPVLKLARRSVGYVTNVAGPALEFQSSGSHLGSVTAELTPVGVRTVHSEQILSEWRRAVGDFPGAESVKFRSDAVGPGGIPIEFKLLARPEHMEALEAAVEESKARLEQFPGVLDITDDSRPGKSEFRLSLRDDAKTMNITEEELAQTVRAVYYGEEVMRLQRGRHEVKLMVRYPKEDRRSMAAFDQIRVRGSDGRERPLTELAEITVGRDYAEINRVNQLRAITITAGLDEKKANARNIVKDLQSSFMPGLLERFPEVSVRWEGQQEQTAESMTSLMVGLVIALAGMFALLTFQFNSYFQPLLIMSIIPFGIVGAIFGHAFMGLTITLFSMFGLVTLTGVVVNDSIVLIDFINARVRSGMPLEEALMESGRRRLRPIFLTSLTTIAGLAPLVMETSFQAQILVPMAVSICFGLGLSTLVVLLLVPTFYRVYAAITDTLTAEQHKVEVVGDERSVVGTH